MSEPWSNDFVIETRGGPFQPGNRVRWRAPADPGDAEPLARFKALCGEEMTVIRVVVERPEAEKYRVRPFHRDDQIDTGPPPPAMYVYVRQLDGMETSFGASWFVKMDDPSEELAP